MKKIFSILLFLNTIHAIHSVQKDSNNQLEKLKISLYNRTRKEPTEYQLEGSDSFKSIVQKVSPLINKSNDLIKFFINSLEKYKVDSLNKSEKAAENDFIAIEEAYDNIRIPQLLVLLINLRDYAGKKTKIGKKIVNHLLQQLDTSRKQLVDYINNEKQSGFYSRTKNIKKRYNAIIKNAHEGYSKYQHLSDQIKQAWGF